MFPLMSVYYGWAQAVSAFFQLQQLNFHWLHWFTTALTAEGPSIISRIGTAGLLALILTAGATGVYFIYKLM